MKWWGLGREPEEPRNLGEELGMTALGGGLYGFPAVDMVESPFLPAGTALMVSNEALGFVDYYPNAVFSEPLWEPIEPATTRYDWKTGETHENPFAEEVAAARRALQANHERLFDGLCNDLGLDPEETWREPRRRELREALWRRNILAVQMEARVAMSVIRPEQFLRINIT